MKGKIANVVVTQGDLFDGGAVRHVFVDGRPVDVVAEAPAAGAGRAGRGDVRGRACFPQISIERGQASTVALI
jgi:hypothetical protein